MKVAWSLPLTSVRRAGEAALPSIVKVIVPVGVSGALAALTVAMKVTLWPTIVGLSDGVTVVVVTFDGYGDSGQIENIEAKAGDEVAALPSGEVEITSAVWGEAELDRTTMTVRDAIERLAYDFLEETHDGWENSDGAYGDFTFDVAERTITLDYNERHMESDYSQHVF